jgi:glycolate oxidase
MVFNIKEKIIQIVGFNNVSDKIIDKLAYSKDASQLSGEPLLIVWPKNAKEIEEIVKTIKNTNYDLIARGSGTNLVGSVVPKNSIILDLTRMNKIININQKNKTVVVEPGIILQDLNKKLKKHNLTFPIKPASYKIATIGGMISTNAGGIYSFKYGKTKNWIQELQIIKGDGEIYNTMNFSDFCGSEGIFGIITQATLELTDTNKQKSYYYKKFKKAKNMLNEIEKYRYNQNVLSIEYMDNITSRILKKDNIYHLFIELNDDTGEITDKDEINEIEQLREKIGATLTKEGFILTQDPWISPKNMLYFIEWLNKMCIPSFGHIGYGIIHPRFRKEHETKINKMIELIKKINGKLNAEHGIGLTKKKYLNEEEIRKIKRLKRKYDPKNIFNKGKVVD